jgi:hypothetical protein
MIDREVEEYFRRMTIVYNDVNIVKSNRLGKNDVIGMSGSSSDALDCSFPFWKKNEGFFEEKKFIDPNIDFIIAEFYNSIN